MKKVSLLLVLVFAATTMFAQQADGTSAGPGRKATFARNGFFDNWFIGAGAGANVFLTKADNDADLFNRPTLTVNGQLGKWFNPYLGVRAKGTYGKIHTFSNHATTMNRMTAVTAEANVLVDLTNYFGKYNENRLYSFIPYAGVGGIYAGKYSNGGPGSPEREKSLTFNAGLINKFRITPRLAVEVELSGILMNNNIDRRPGTRAYNLMGNASANLVYKIGKAGFSEAVLMDQGLIDDLNDQINRLRQDNSKLSSQLPCPKCPEVKPCPPSTVAPPAQGGSFVSNVVFFRLGSANIDNNQEVSIFNTAKYLQDNPNAKVKVVGYADKKTGSASINNKLSEKRAKNVANALINKYKINSSRVTVEWKGDTEQPYAENAWNRVAIFFAQ